MAQLPGWLGCFHLVNLSVHYKTWSVWFSGGNSTSEAPGHGVCTVDHIDSIGACGGINAALYCAVS